MSRRPRSPHRLLTSVALAGVLALATAGCSTTGGPLLLRATGSAERVATTPAVARSEADWRREVDTWGARYRADPSDRTTAMAYAKALSATERRAEAVSVLEQISLRNPKDPALLGAYGRALADAGRFEQALDVLGRAHSPDRPDWRILSAQGAVLDQLGRHKDAQAYYASALKIAPGEPTVLSNLGLSYALAKDLRRAEATLREAVGRPDADPRVRQNLALVVGLQGRFTDAEDLARADLPADEASANVAYLREMLAEKGDIKRLGRPAPIAARGRS
ncbi:tetratricopeptide repeat protein [Rhodoplanes serenus]|uniref:Tetratricopeptide repeat protein n=1 Tax=Rhodoplanes serenus TaxID=200615 RepID=A0A9X4XQZ1_9BRAD|nr:tetratricopeptide repeat protein [Rhodoplanes serenus]